MASDVHTMSEGGIARSSVLCGGSNHSQLSANPVLAPTRRSDSPTPELTRRSDSPTLELTQCSDSPTPALTRRSSSPAPELTRRSESPNPALSQRSESPNPALSQRSESPNPALSQRSESPNPALSQRSESPNPALSQRSESPNPALSQRSESPNPALSQRSESPNPALSQRSESPNPALSQRSESPNPALTRRSDSPTPELRRRSESPTPELRRCSESPNPALSQRSESPNPALSQRSDSPALELTQRSDSPGTTLTQGTEPGASQDEAMFVHARSYEDLTGEDDDTVPRSPGVEVAMEPSSMELISQDFNKLSTQLSVSSLQEEDQTREGTSEPGTRDATRSVSGEEEVFTAVDAWYQHQKHVFVLSEAGKPVYSRYRSEEVLSSTAGVMIALVSFLEAEDNAIRSIHADGYKVVFVRRSPLVLVSVSHTLQSEQEIAQELIYVYYQILSLLTGTQLHHLFQQRPSYDLRRLLTGSERITDSLLDLMDVDPSFLLGAVRCLPLAPAVRESVSSSLQQAKAKSLVFSILMSKNQLVSLVRKDDQLLHYVDLHLLFNLVTSSSSFREGEAWTPVCFPKFNPSGFFHAHISYLSHDPELCLMLISTDREDFFTVSDCKQKIVERLEKRGYWGPLNEGLKSPFYDVAQVGIQELRHFLYKSKSSGLFTSPAMGPPYHTDAEKKRLLSLYQFLHSKAHCSTQPLPTIYHLGPRENILAWVTDAFEFYVCFSPFCTKISAVSSVHRLLRWVRREEERMFILTSHTY